MVLCTDPTPVAEPKANEASGRRFWQFTLRETMFALVALCAVIALFSQPRFESSEFFKSFDAETIVSEVIADLGFTGTIGARGEYLTDEDFAHRKAHICLNGLTNAESIHVVDALQARMAKQLDSNGYAANCSVTPAGKCHEFFFDYHSNNNYGTVFVFSDAKSIDESQEPRIRLVFVMHEFQHDDSE